jgi:hypothetical protein
VTRRSGECNGKYEVEQSGVEKCNVGPNHRKCSSISYTGEVTSERGMTSFSELNPFPLNGRLVLMAFKPSGLGKDRVLENAPLGSESGLPG